MLKSPAKQRGRDFGIILRCFSELGYAVEWRVINAADYGCPQRRRRTYIFAFKKNTKYYQDIQKLSPSEIFLSDGIFAKAFPIKKEKLSLKSTSQLMTFNDIVSVSNSFSFPFENTGLLLENNVYSAKTTPIFETAIALNKIIESNVDSHYYLNDNQIEQFHYLRGCKKIHRVDSFGHEYVYSEGAMSEYDDISLPGRTMLTSEGSINRSTHIIKDPTTNRLRILTPVECERLNQFPDNWTNDGMPEKRRYFLMGNALVCGIVSRLGKFIEKIIEDEK